MYRLTNNFKVKSNPRGQKLNKKDVKSTKSEQMHGLRATEVFRRDNRDGVEIE